MTEREIVAVDIGGTHARFAIATIRSQPHSRPASGWRDVVRLDHVEKLITSDHPGLEAAWEAYGRRLPRPLPPVAAIAIAAPVEGAVIRLTNNAWQIDKAAMQARLGLHSLLFLNDFGAIGHAAAQLGHAGLRHVAGPDTGLPEQGVVSIVGPGTGLGVAILLTGAHPRVIETEGGHIGLAPTDQAQDTLLAWLYRRHHRLSAERLVSGPGLVAIMEGLAAIEGIAAPELSAPEAWNAALAGHDPLAARAFDIFCQLFGSVCGDFVLAHGASALVLAGGITERIGDRLRSSLAFRRGFAAKGRFEARMGTIPIRRIAHAEPGLLGAAAALAAGD